MRPHCKPSRGHVGWKRHLFLPSTCRGCGRGGVESFCPSRRGGSLRRPHRTFGTSFLGNGPFAGRSWLRVFEQILAWFEYATVIVSEDLIAFLIAEFSNPSGPFADASSRGAKLLRTHHSAHVREKVVSELFPGSAPGCHVYPAIRTSRRAVKQAFKLAVTAFAKGGGKALPTWRYDCVFPPENCQSSGNP